MHFTIHIRRRKKGTDFVDNRAIEKMHKLIFILAIIETYQTLKHNQITLK